MTSSTSQIVGRSPITIAAGFLGAFIVGSLAVQLVRSQNAAMQAGASAVEPVIASPATLWADLGARDLASSTQPITPAAATTASPQIEPVVGSEATLWSPLGAR